MKNAKMIRNCIALGTASLGTLLSVIYFFNMESSFASTLFGMSIILGLVSYILGGGIIDAVKGAAKIGKIGWLIVPFPIDLVVGLMTTVFAVLLFLCCPIIFVGKTVLPGLLSRGECA